MINLENLKRNPEVSHSDLIDKASAQTTTLNLFSIERFLHLKHLPQYLQKLRQCIAPKQGEIQFDPPWLGIAIAYHLNDDEMLNQQLEKAGIDRTKAPLHQQFSTFPPEECLGNTLWHHLAWSGHYEILEKAIQERYFDPTTLKNDTGNTVWHFLALSGNFDALQKAIQQGLFDPKTVKNKDDATVWHFLALSGNLEALQKAIQEKLFDPSTLEDHNGNTVWHYLALSGSLEVLQKAIQEKLFDPSTLKNKAGSTVWHFLAWSRNLDALQKAIQQGLFDPSTVKNNFGNTVWHYLALSGNFGTLQKAIQRGLFDPNIVKNKNGRTVWELLSTAQITHDLWLKLIRSGVLTFFLSENQTFFDLCQSRKLPFELPKEIPLLMEAFIGTGQFIASTSEEIDKVREKVLSCFKDETNGTDKENQELYSNMEKMLESKGQNIFKAMSEQCGFSLGTQTPALLRLDCSKAPRPPQPERPTPRDPASLFAFAAHTLKQNGFSSFKPSDTFLPPEVEESLHMFWKWMDQLEVKASEENAQEDILLKREGFLGAYSVPPRN